jgi:predicted XRE-type DNA-binding protein
LENYFTSNYFIETLNIPENKVSEYVKYCYINFELDKLVTANNYDKITQILEEQAPIYLSKIQKNE